MKGEGIRLAKEQMQNYSDKYCDNLKESDLEHKVEQICKLTKHPAFLTKEQFLTIGCWKSRRITHHLVKNSEDLIQETTTLALATRSVRLAPQILMAMDGVGLPMASAILHWCHSDVFPILDFRALWSLGIEMPGSYSLAFWEDYVTLWREIHEEWGCEKRELDRALWQYSKEHQP